MKKSVVFLFVIDVSGSMYGQKIASVNASLSECIAVLRQIDYDYDYDIRISVVSFAESMRKHVMDEKPDSISALQIEVKPQADGFYAITSFGCLYEGLKGLFEEDGLLHEKQGEDTFVFLFSDAKPVDERNCQIAYEAIHKCVGFPKAVKYVGFVEEKMDKFNKETVVFVEYKADHIMRIADIPEEINKLRMTYFSNSDDDGDNAKYDEIFV